jgi:starch synthase (maltosyl-transferring)
VTIVARTESRVPRELPPDGRRRVVVEGVQPAVDSGRFAAKAVAGVPVVVTADVFADGHDPVRAALRVRRIHPAAAGRDAWFETPMEPLGNDRHRAEFVPETPGRYEFTVVGWVDHFGAWRDGLRKKAAAGAVAPADHEIGARLLDDAAGRAGAAAGRMRAAATRVRRGESDAVAADDELGAEVALVLRTEETVHFPLLVDADRPLAEFGAWYEVFPRSTAPEPGRPGTFADVEAFLPYVASMGFDVVYFPPIHPIGTTNRKGRNNSLDPDPSDTGSPWAIGSDAGGHKAVDPALGTLEDFRRVVKAAESLGLEVALDIAFQCSPDHPYTREHPEWFRHRPDGSIQYAENPPKKYEDIFPFDFETEAWPSLWHELRSIFEFWIEQGVSVFRVDNPHTKSFPFWEWCVGDLRRAHPDVILLSEAFTRPRVMERLAKLGFHQSYTYFTWRNTAWELRTYFEELTATGVADFLRPNVWPNTPDILSPYLQEHGRPAFVIRAVLAATLASAYGVYGPAFELFEHTAREPGSEEYLDSEKYEVRHWDLDRPDSLRPLLTRLNAIRRSHPALQSNRTLRFHDVDNENLLCYSKRDAATRDVVLCVVDVDPRQRQAGTVHLDLEALGLPAGAPFRVRDLLGGATYSWRGADNYVELDPLALPAHVFSVERG